MRILTRPSARAGALILTVLGSLMAGCANEGPPEAVDYLKAIEIPGFERRQILPSGTGAAMFLTGPPFRQPITEVMKAPGASFRPDDDTPGSGRFNKLLVNGVGRLEGRSECWFAVSETSNPSDSFKLSDDEKDAVERGELAAITIDIFCDAD